MSNQQKLNEALKLLKEVDTSEMEMDIFYDISNAIASVEFALAAIKAQAISPLDLAIADLIIAACKP
jgi:hypothetical protein